MKRINKRAAAKQVGEPDQGKVQPQSTTDQNSNQVGTALASTGTGNTDGAGTGVAGEFAPDKAQDSATGQNDECHETSIVPQPIAPLLAETPEPIVLPPANELAAIEPVLPPTQVDYSALDTKALDAAIVKSLEIAGHYAKQFDAEKKAHLLPALMEMETRWNKKQGARSDLSRLPIYGKCHDYLRHCGLKPSTYRGWKKGYYDALALTTPQLGGESASLPNSDVLTSVQKEVVSALVGQGYGRGLCH
jgi:hypothetical protein